MSPIGPLVAASAAGVAALAAATTALALLPWPERRDVRAGEGSAPYGVFELPLLPDVRVLEPHTFYVVDERPNGPRRLKFTTTFWNAGPGTLEVTGADDGSGASVVTQVLRTSEGTALPYDAVGEFTFDHRHGHLHLDAFARYELWAVDGDWDLTEMVAVNEKVGFCLMDNFVVDEALAALVGDPVYPIDCDADVQGVSPGYGDVYVAQLFEQDLVIDDVEDGIYAVVNIANAGGELLEVTLENNSATTFVRLEGRRAWRVDPPGHGAGGATSVD